MAAKCTIKHMQTAVDVMAKSGRFDRVLTGCTVVAPSTTGRCVVELELKHEHSNGYGTLHGGFTAAIADMVTTIALYNTKIAKPGVSVDLNVSYMGTAKVGDVVQFDGYILKHGRTLAFTQMDARRVSDNRLLAQARHTKAFPSYANV